VNDLKEKYGVVLHSVTEPIDTSNCTGEMIFTLLAGFAAKSGR
jgi:site-specific DNA recombinase